MKNKNITPLRRFRTESWKSQHVLAPAKSIYRFFSHTLAFTYASLILGSPVPSLAQTAAAGPSETALVLPVFEVSTKKDVGYKSTNSASVTRIDAQIKDLPLSVQILNQEFINDLGKGNLFDLATYFAGGDNHGGIQAPMLFKLRGFFSANHDDQQRDGFRFLGLTDMYNVDRVEVIRGPNSVVHGTADPGGQVNVISKSARQHENFTSIGMRIGSYNLQRATLDVNQSGSIGRVDAAVRVNLVTENSESFMKFVEQHVRSMAVAASFKLSRTTDLVLKGERNYTNAVEAVTLVDRWSGAPGYFGGLSIRLNRNVSGLYAYDEGNSVGGPDNAKKHQLTNALAELTQQLGDKAAIKLQLQKSEYDYQYFNATGSAGILNYNATTDTYFTQNRWAWTDLMNERVNARLLAHYNLDLGWTEQKILAGYSFFKVDEVQLQDLLFDDATNQQTNFNVPLKAGQLTAAATRIDSSGRSWRARAPIRSSVKSPSYFVSANGSYLSGRLRTLLGYSWNKSKRLDDVFAVPAAGSFLDKLPIPNATGVNRTHQTAGIPMVSVVYAVTPSINVYALYSESFKPQTTTIPLININTGVVGGNLGPETGQGKEAGVKFDLIDKKLSGTVGFFDTIKGNLYQLVDPQVIFAFFGPNHDTRYSVDGSKQRSKGVEVEMFYNPSPNLTLAANYAYLDAFISANPSQPQLVGRIANLASWNSGSVVGKYTFTQGTYSGFFVGGNIFARSKNYVYAGPESSANAGFVIFGLFAGYNGRVDKTHYTIQLNVDNLTDKKYLRSYAYFGTPRSMSVSSTVRF